MTTPPPAGGAAEVPGMETEENHPWIVEPTMGSRLEALHAAYPDAKARADEADAQLKAITDGIKAAALEEAPEGQTRVEVQGPSGPPLRLTYTESWRLDSKRLKAQHPETWVRFAVKGGSWALRPAGGGE